MYVVRGCMFMTDAARERCPEGRAPQSRTDTASASQSTFRCGRAIGRRLLHFAASSLPLPGTRAAIEGACSAWRSQIGIYRQASTQPDSAGPSVRHNETIVHQRGGQPGVARAVSARARAWVSRNQFGNGTCSWNIGSTVYCQISRRKPTSYWCQSGVKQSEERLRNQRRPQLR